MTEKLVSRAIWSENMQREFHANFSFKYADMAILSIKAIKSQLKERSADEIYNQIRALPNLENPELVTEAYFQNDTSSADNDTAN